MMLSVKYHNIFDYKLVKSDFPKWSYKTDPKILTGVAITKDKKRLQREKYSRAKLLIAKKASVVLSKIPTVKFVGVTGSLAMMNSDKNSDIDLMIITQKNSLWTTRLLVYMVIHAFGFGTRKPNDFGQEDKLCFNIWLDETDLVWDKKDHNIYIAHEIAQIMPLINKEKTYERFLWENKWILNYWPNSVRISNLESGIWKEKTRFYILYSIFLSIEKLAFNLQKFYMSKKITRETITPTRALFHPQDWGKVVLERLKS